jgi:hypothetical protein
MSSRACALAAEQSRTALPVDVNACMRAVVVMIVEKVALALLCVLQLQCALTQQQQQQLVFASARLSSRVSWHSSNNWCVCYTC